MTREIEIDFTLFDFRTLSRWAINWFYQWMNYRFALVEPGQKRHIAYLWNAWDRQAIDLALWLSHFGWRLVRVALVHRVGDNCWWNRCSTEMVRGRCVLLKRFKFNLVFHFWFLGFSSFTDLTTSLFYLLMEMKSKICVQTSLVCSAYECVEAIKNEVDPRES